MNFIKTKTEARAAIDSGIGLLRHSLPLAMKAIGSASLDDQIIFWSYYHETHRAVDSEFGDDERGPGQFLCDGLEVALEKLKTRKTVGK